MKVKNKIVFKVEGVNSVKKSSDLKYGELVDVIIDNENIGNLIISKEDEELRLSIDFFVIKQRLRAMGYGTKIMESFKLYVKSLGFKSITGTCSDELIAFYKKAGAYFEDKLGSDYPHVNNKFYIEL